MNNSISLQNNMNTEITEKLHINKKERESYEDINNRDVNKLNFQKWNMNRIIHE